ncbi:MAG TPA: prolyl-tRNA synthetase associated domain-containing protein [Candidatus Babeliales bacterium]|nr:prolyl-tRNA synthetase associated domain-containing protein [Candidatus Babeliales bacterium]
MHEKELFDILHRMQIKTNTYEHEPAFAVQDAVELKSLIPGSFVKNLFLKDRNKKYWLVVALFETKIQLKKLAKRLNAPELRFASPEELEKILKVQPGSVTPFALMHDTNHEVNVLLDKQIELAEKIGIHPLRNTATTLIGPEDLKKFIAYCGNQMATINFSELI